MTDITFRKEAEGAFQRDAKEIGNLNARLGLVTKLGGLIAARAPVEDLRQACVTGLIEVIDCERAAITSTDRSTGRPSVLVQRARSGATSLRPLPGETNISRVDLQEPGSAARKCEPADRNRPPASIVAAPYEESGAADGTLSMETGREDAFTESDSQFPRTLAAHLEIAALGAGRTAPGDSRAALAPLKSAIPALRARGNLVPEDSDSRNSAFSSLAEIREAGMDRVFDAIRCDHVAIAGVDPDSGRLDIVAERGMTGDRPEDPLGAEAPFSIRILREHHNKMLASPDRTYRSESRLDSIALVAIDVGGEVAGSLAVASRREYGLDDLSVESLRATAEELGEAIGAFQVLENRRRLRRTRDLEYLSAGVAHHTNNDAAVIEFALAAIMSEEDQSRRESVEIIRRSARGIAGGARLIRAYMDGAGAERLQNVDLAALVEAALGLSEAVDQSRPAPGVDTPEPPANIVGSTILVIDDEAMLRRSLARVLDREGCETSVAAGGEEALEIFTAERFDAVICDLKMLGIDGWEVAEKMHQINPDCPVIILTGVTGTTSDELKNRPGVATLLEKPCSVADISRTVSRVAGR